MHIRRPLLLKACDEARWLDEKNRSQGRPVKDATESPFVNDWKLQSAEGGKFKTWLFKLLEGGHIAKDDINTLLSLNGAEAWALTAALYHSPVKPDPITGIFE